jgi:hypothetical protein
MPPETSPVEKAAAGPSTLPDTRPDGIDSQLIQPSYASGTRAPAPEFSAETRVLYVNGINTNDREARLEGRAYASAVNHPVELVHVATRGLADDIGRAAGEMLGPAAKDLERAIAGEVLSLAMAGKDIHIMAYSRGALVVERGLELAESEMQRRGLDSAQQAKVFSHVTLETVNGASHYVPDGVRAVHYVREGDVLVGQAIGMGPAAPFVRAAIAAGMLRAGDSAGLIAEARDGFFNHPNGPIIEVPPLKSLNPIDQHLFIPMLSSRSPFNETYAKNERENSGQLDTHPQPTPVLPAQPLGASPTSLHTTDMTAHQLGVYASARMDFRAIFADKLGTLAALPSVALDRAGDTSREQRFATTGRIVGLEDGKLIQDIGRGRTAAFDYGDLVANARDSAHFDAMTRQAIATGQPVQLAMIGGQVSLTTEPEPARGLQLGNAHAVGIPR